MKTPKIEWGPGPWENEPEDAADWTDEATGYLCAARRNNGGAWCGYVRIPADHPLHEVAYNADVPARLVGAAEAVMNGPVGSRGVMNIFCMAVGDKAHAGDLFDVHGSITYSGDKWPGDGYWYGFDCSHCDDHSPAYDAYFKKTAPHLADTRGEYRTLDYVKDQCASLARQLQGLVVPFPA